MILIELKPIFIIFVESLTTVCMLPFVGEQNAKCKKERDQL